MTTIDYDAWAGTYDDTRAVSPSVLQPILEALGPPAGRSLLDIGGGTGNFAASLARAGFQLYYCDFSSAMARRAAAKLPSARLLAVADAQRLPFREQVFDCGVSVNVLGHLPDWRLALRDAARVLRDGPLVLKLSTLETMQSNWVLEYIPDYLEHQPRHLYQSEETIASALRESGFVQIEVARIHYSDAVDGSFQALKRFPEAFLDAQHIRNTAVFKRLPEPTVLRALGEIRRDHASGRLAELIARYEPLSQQYGDGSLFIAKP